MSTQTIAITPIAPIWLSFMISRIRSPRAGTQEAVGRVGQSIEVQAAGEAQEDDDQRGGRQHGRDRPGTRPQASPAATAPSNRPISGNQGTLRARSSSAVPQAPGPARS